MVRVEELPSICMYVSYLFQVSCVNQEPTAYAHCRGLGIPVNLEDMHGAPQPFQNFRQNCSDQLKLLYD